MFFLIFILYIPIKVILAFIESKYGKLSYEGFSAMGFAYDNDKKVFYSTKNAWQKKFGYCHFYDVIAPFFQIFIDTEPIKFYYNNKNWLITFWKGQYGITTGAEIGVYNTFDKIVNKKTIYFPANENEMLDMSFTLYKNNKEITSIKSTHWWLAIFKIGMYSKAKDLSMDIQIKFPNKEMLSAFLNSFKNLKHKNYKIENNTFYFKYEKPRSKRVWTNYLLSNIVRKHVCKKNVYLYNLYLKDVTNNDNYKKKIKINDFVPKILKNKQKINLEKNVIFLNNIVDSNLKQVKNEKEIE